MKKLLLFFAAAVMLLSACGRVEKILIPGQENVPEDYRFYYLVKGSGDNQKWGIEGAIKHYPKLSERERRQGIEKEPTRQKVYISPKWDAAEILGIGGGFRLLKDGMWHAYSLEGKPIGELPYFTDCVVWRPHGSPHYTAQLKLMTPSGIFMAFQDDRVQEGLGDFPTFVCQGPYEEAEFGYQGYFYKDIDEFEEGCLWGYNVFDSDKNEIVRQVPPGNYALIELADPHSYLTTYYFLGQGVSGWQFIGRGRTVPPSSYYQGRLFRNHLPVAWSGETILEWVNQLPEGEFTNLLLPGNKDSFKGFWYPEKGIGLLMNQSAKGASGF